MTARQTHQLALQTFFQIHEYAKDNLPRSAVRDLGFTSHFADVFDRTVDVALAVRGLSRVPERGNPGTQVLLNSNGYLNTVMGRTGDTLHLRNGVGTEWDAPASYVISVAAWEVIANDVLEAAERLRGQVNDAIRRGRKNDSEKTTSETGGGKMTRATGEVIDFGVNEVLVRIRDRWHVVNLTETQVFDDYAMESLIEEVGNLD